MDYIVFLDRSKLIGPRRTCWGWPQKFYGLLKYLYLQCSDINTTNKTPNSSLFMWSTIRFLKIYKCRGENTQWWEYCSLIFIHCKKISLSAPIWLAYRKYTMFPESIVFKAYNRQTIFHIFNSTSNFHYIVMPFVFVILACTKSNDNCLAFPCVYDVNSINITSCIFCVDPRKDRDFICIYSI